MNEFQLAYKICPVCKQNLMLALHFDFKARECKQCKKTYPKKPCIKADPGNSWKKIGFTMVSNNKR